MFHTELNGAWEEKGVIGTRIEISGRKIVILWRSAPVLETTFRVKKQGEKKELLLQKNGMRYQNAATDYATVESLTYENEKITFVENFPITGQSTKVLTATANSRYGDYTIADQFLPLLKGTWKNQHDFFELQFSGNQMTLNGRRFTIHLLHANWERDPDRLKIADVDPSKDDFPGIYGLEYCNGTITAREMICDAPPTVLIYHKI